jgi:hypothetical protein
MAGVPEATSVYYWGQCGELVRALGLSRSYTPILYTINYFYHNVITTDVILSDRRMPSCLEGQPECHEAHKNPHRSADINRHHREPRIRPNQCSDKGTEPEIRRSLASTQATMRSWKALGRDGEHYCILEVGEHAAHAIEGKIHRSRLCSGVAEQEGTGYDG